MSKVKNLDTIEKMMDGYNPYRQRQEETRQLVSKWEPTGLLEGLSDDNKVHNMAVLLENNRQLIDEASSTDTSTLKSGGCFYLWFVKSLVSWRQNSFLFVQ